MAGFLGNTYLKHIKRMNKYKVLLVDDHPILLEGSKNLINSSELYKVTFTATNVQSAMELIKSEDFDILITDYEMGDLTGSELIQMAKVAQPEIKTIILSMHDSPAIVKELLKLGVNGYVLKRDSHESMLAALDKVTNGKRYLSDNIASILIEGIDQPPSSALTPREEEIVKLIVKEFSTKQIAEILFISQRTVETHRKNILKKTKSSNLVALIKYAYDHKLV